MPAIAITVRATEAVAAVPNARASATPQRCDEPIAVIDQRAVAPRSYTDDEVEAIFRRALEQQESRADGLGHEELIAAAREVGLDEHAIERAIAEVGRERTREDIRKAIRDRRRSRWLRHLFTYLVIVGAFLGLHALGMVGPWVYWMAFGWGIGVALSSVRGLRAPSDEEVEREERKLNRRERRKARAIARREARKAREDARRRKIEDRAEARRRRQNAGAELERVIDEGVALLLSAAAKKLNEAARPPKVSAPKTDFDRYVARRKGQPAEAPRERPAATPPVARVRVEADAPEDRSRRRPPRDPATEEEELEVERDERSRTRRRR